jgi:hypothetical protein
MSIVAIAGLSGNANIADITAANELKVNATLAAGTNLIGSVAAGLRTDVIFDGITILTPKFAVINFSAADSTLVAAVASRKIRVVSLFVVAAGTVNVRFESGTGGTALTGQVPLVANTGFVLGFNPVGWFETAVNTLLNLELSGGIAVHGSLTYIEAL